MSVFHQYIELSDKVYKRYTKTQIGVLSGRRADPHDLRKQTPFVLSTPESVLKYREDSEGHQDIDGRIKVDYDSEVLETYSLEEDKLFHTLNKRLFQDGLLVEYLEDRAEVTYENALTDREVQALASTKSLYTFKKDIKPITSQVTLQRIQEALQENDRPNSFQKLLKEHMDGITA